MVDPEDIAPPGPLLRERFSPSASGRRWLERAPRLAAHYAEIWQLELGRPLKSSSTFCLPCRDLQGNDLLLRIFPSLSAARLEALAFSVWQGGAPHLFRRDTRRGVVLLERVRPGILPGPQGRLPQAAALLEVISRARPASDQLLSLPRLKDQVEQGQSRLELELWPGPELRAQALKRLRVGPRRLLHGRFSPLGVVESREGWVMVSPRPALGDPCYDAACWALTDQHSGSVRHNIEFLATRSSLPEDRIRELAWIIAALEFEIAPDHYRPRLKRFMKAAGSDQLVRDLGSVSLPE